MDKYNVSLTNRALRDLDGIYVYIAQTLPVPETALGLVNKIEKEILSSFCTGSIPSLRLYALTL